MITRIKLSTMKQDLPKYRSMLAGNPSYVPPSFESIATATGTGSSGVITFSSISGSYQSLQIRYTANIASGAGTDIVPIVMTFNGVTSSSYRSHYLTGDGASASAGADGSAQTGGYILIADSGAGTSIQGVGIIDIHNYTSTSQNKTVRVFQGMDKNGTGGTVRLSSTLFVNTSAITSVTFTTLSGSFNTGTQFALYGIKG